MSAPNDGGGPVPPLLPPGEGGTPAPDEGPGVRGAGAPRRGVAGQGPAPRFAALFALLIFVLGGVAIASSPGLRAIAQRPFAARGTVVVPDRFVRAWDPVTVFFESARGPAAGGPEDAPGRFVTVTPDHPGAWTWLDGKTLQFKPAEMWPALARYAWTVDGRTTEVATLMTPPSATLPADGAEGLGPVETITLTFSERLAPEALARMVSIELRPLPGVDTKAARWLGNADFRVKAMEESAPEGRSWSPPDSVWASPGEGETEGGDTAGEEGSGEEGSGDTGGSNDTGSSEVVVEENVGHRYVLTLDTPIPLGTRAIVHFRLSRDDAATESVADVSFATAEPFRVARLGCGDRLLPVTPAGVVYAEDQAVACASGRRTVVVEFTARPAGIGPVEARNLLRFEPEVADLTFALSGKRLEVSGRFVQETAYRVTVVPTPLSDVDGRSLQLAGESVVPLWFPRREDYLRFVAGEGLVERFGPQLVPMEGRGQERVDLRIYAIDPLDRGFWPYPQNGVTVDEAARPPGPGEEPAEETEALATPGRDDLAARIALLGSPGISKIVPLPLGDDRDAATFGLDLAPHLAELSGKGTPGAYLVGVRPLDGTTTRSWLRVQVTDLTLTTIEETGGVRFLVTSLATSSPIAGAEVRLEGGASRDGSTTWARLASGRTSGDGAFTWTAPGNVVTDVRSRLRRIVVEKGADRLVLDADRPPASFADNHWRATSGDWLQWGFGSLESRGPKPASLCTLFSERPMYRPEDAVHLKGWLRKREKGVLTPIQGPGRVVVEGPGDLAWRLPVTTSATGGFYVKFAEGDLPSGTYQAHFEGDGGISCGRMSFQMEAYRLPTFEATIHAPDKTPLDGPFDVKLVASYFAGGRVAGQPVRWRVTQFPATYAPAGREGFLWSSDGRYSGEARFDATPRFESEGVTDAEGGATIVLDPSIEPTAQPRTYVVEATVTGADDQTVTTTRRVEAVPAFVLGLKVPRYLEQAPIIPAELVVAGVDGKLKPGQPVTVRLFARRWDSHLQASDFSDGKARYVTDVVDEKLSETVVTSDIAPSKLSLPAARAGVYIVEIESRDRLGRAQVVKVDLYVGGAEPVAWQKPQAGVFTVATDRSTYDPGTSATLVVQSPFQKADALVIVEAPEGNRYQWVTVTGGSAMVRVPIEPTWVPRIPIHVVLMRGRMPGTEPVGNSTTDLGKPATLASTTWLAVNPVENTVVVKVENPARATPGETVPVTVRLTTPKGKPVAGEVTLWLVDQAVLTLAKEQRLDPLPDFITAVRSFLTLRDTRNLAFGRIPFAEMPGGDGGAEEENPLERAAVRRNFQSVPYYQAALEVGADGVRTVQVKLPDDLTVFKIRAKAAAGPDRFGVGTSEIAVRLPVLVQPALPRFVRPGDRFVATGVARVVEGAGGAGSAGLKVEGLLVDGATKGEATQKLALDPNAATTVSFPVTVATPGWTADGQPARSSVLVRMGVARTADGASDAFEVSLPIRADRDMVVRRDLYDIAVGGVANVPGIPEAARPGTLKRAWLASDDPAVVRMAGALDFFGEYPYGTTEARISRARAYLALGALRGAIGMHDADGRTDRAVAETLAWLPGVIDGRGRVAQWPGTQGTVSLTAWAMQFLVEAKAAGRPVDDALVRTLGDALAQALRSDYGDFVDGEAYVERAMALEALSASGRFDAAYFAELARGATFLDAEGVAGVVIAATQGSQGPEAVGRAPVLRGLVTLLGDGVLTRLWQGREVYAGIPGARQARSGLVLPSETRTIARIARALTRAAPDHPRAGVLREALITLGRGDGWGSTNANAEAMLALAEGLAARAGGWKVEVTEDGKVMEIAPKAGAVGTAMSTTAAAAVARASGAGVILRVDTRYLPQADGGQVAAAANGFVVARTLELVRADGPSDKVELVAGARVRVAKGGVVEDHVQVVVPEDRTYVAIEVPLAAGLEPLNPRLATAPPEATPRIRTTRAPTYADWRDDVVIYYYDVLPKGTYDLAFRARATVTGDFVQPPARAVRLYDAAVTGWSAGARVVVE
ncbi:MAG: alpha-2-macroglobulin family protein [Pseudomonadota bacterium]|nr:alpha-2-macroglobulin family protein [Pseudomonadota bacterium]